MADYERLTATPLKDVLAKAEEYLTGRIPLEKVESDDHSVTLTGGDGTVVIRAHQHGLQTVVHVSSDRVRTSRMDVEIQHYLNQLPYEPGDAPGIQL